MDATMGRYRSNVLGIRLRPDERDEIEEAARRSGKWTSELAREAALRSARRVLRDTDSEPTRN